MGGSLHTWIQPRAQGCWGGRCWLWLRLLRNKGGLTHGPGAQWLSPVPSKRLHVARWLGPFLLTCTIYFLLWNFEDLPSPLSALLKCLPVLSLAVSLWGLSPGRGFSALLPGALLCSAVGDICLVWPDAFLYGMAAFAAAHLLYLAAFGFSPLHPATLLPIVLVCSPYYSFLLPHLPPDMALPMAAYALLLVTVLWRGLVQGGSAGLGALLFTISDAVLAWDTFAQPLPYAPLVVMTTYYAAQALITLSAISGPRSKTN